MRGALHVLALAVVLPYVALAYAFVVLGQAASSGSLLGVMYTLLNHFVWMVPWGIIGAACAVVAIALLGLIPRTRSAGALCLAIVAAVALAIIVIVGSAPLDAGAILFLLPCIGIVAFEAWLWSAERRPRGLPLDVPHQKIKAASR